jgi:hypothetical protein
MITDAQAPLLSSLQMAEFVANGMLRFEAVLPPELCLRGQRELAAGRWTGGTYDETGADYEGLWPDSAFGVALRHPVIRGAIHSLVGRNPRFDHRAAHLVPAGSRRGPNLHQDAELDDRFASFDIQLSIFLHDVPKEMVGTVFRPGTHFRRTKVQNTNRYHHVVGQAPTVCPMGTVVIWHQNLWHAARSNRTDQDRYMFKVRLNPRVPQVRLWDLSDLDHPDIPGVLSSLQPWMGNEGRTKIINRLRLWRHLSGISDYDVHSWLTRLEHRGTSLAERALQPL